MDFSDYFEQNEHVEDIFSDYKIEVPSEFLKRHKPQRQALTLQETIDAFKANQRLARLAQMQSAPIL